MAVSNCPWIRTFRVTVSPVTTEQLAENRTRSRNLGGPMNCHKLEFGLAISFLVTSIAAAQEKKHNIVLIVSDDTGYGDLGPYGGGEGRGMPTPNIDRLANEGMQFYGF